MTQISFQDYRTYVKQDWMRKQLQVYELLRRLRDDPYFRNTWVENTIKQRIADDPGTNEAELRDLLLAYNNELDFRIAKNKKGMPVVHISPKTFRGQSYSRILGISSKNLSTCLNKLVESAVEDIIKGYGKGTVLSGIFGTEFGRLFNRYAKRRMQEEFS